MSESGKGLLYENKGSAEDDGYCDVDQAGLPSEDQFLGYYVIIAGNLVSWKSTKQSIVARTKAKAKYHTMAASTSEQKWLKQLLQEL